MSNNRIAIKRINKDIKEITKNPIEGVGIVSLDDNPMVYVINMRLMSGPYEGYCVQLLLTFTNNYPAYPPRILIFPGQAIDNIYHHHIFDDPNNRDENGLNFKKFCFDLLDNEFMDISNEKTGWNPSYTISSLLLQVQNFIADPDKEPPSKYYIDQLMESMENYSRTFPIHTEKGIVQRVHTWKDPYPEMYFKKNEKNEKNEKDKEADKLKEEKEKEKKKEEEHRIQIIKDNLNCYMLKLNYIDDPDILLGYPIIQKKGKYGKNKIDLYPIPELLTYEGFLSQGNMQGHMADLYFNFNVFKSANNEYYNNWVPIYINKDHYEKNKTTILNSFNRILTGNNFNAILLNNLQNNNNKKYNSEQIFKVLPMILNSMIIGLFNGKTTCSSSFIRCYFQYILLFKKLCQEFEGEYLDYLNTKFNEIKTNNYVVNKEIIPDIGNFFILLLFCNLDTNTERMKKIYNSLYEDSLVRQMYWMFHGEECKHNMKKLLLKGVPNEQILSKFENNESFKMRKLSKFNEDLHKKGIYEKIVDIICQDKEFLEHIFLGAEKVRGVVETRITKSFKRLFCECSKEGRKQLGELLNANLVLSKYFDSNELDEKGLYDQFRVDEMLKDQNLQNLDEILKYAFENQKGNKLYIITFFAQKKIEEKGFLEELEKNYGVYIDVDNFIKEMKQKLDEIKSYKDFYAYIGTDYGKDKTELELIIQAYEKAKEKSYIRTNNPPSNLLNPSSSSINQERGRDFRYNRRNIEDSRYNNNYNNRNNDRDRRRGRRRSRSYSRSYNSSISSRDRRREDEYDRDRRRRRRSRSYSNSINSISSSESRSYSSREYEYRNPNYYNRHNRHH